MDRFDQLVQDNVPADMPEFRRSSVVLLMRLAHEDGKNEILERMTGRVRPETEEKGGAP
jgi:hypothetical protein